MADEYRNNHYVPKWYQKRFLSPGENELYYLDLNPGEFLDPRGVHHRNKALKKQGTKLCFFKKDLYTTKIDSITSTDIEKYFFGKIDTQGRKGVEYFTDFDYPPQSWGDSFNYLVNYMSIQKLRTPKGLDWLKNEVKTSDRNIILSAMLELRGLYCANWTESVWLIADASQSNTKFIISDHPVTVYNRRCGPKSDWCRGYSDPDVWLNGTQTIFPLSQNKVLILTNLSWVRNPYQSETTLRPNPDPFRSAIFKITDIQVRRFLNEKEVREINFIIKSRAYRYIAAAKEEWLYPERYISKADWNNYGNGYLLMPDPRGVTYGGEIVIGHKNGTASWYDEYGHRPWQEGYRRGEERSLKDWDTFQNFKGEFSRLFGPYRRGRAYNTMSIDNEKDNDAYHKHNLSLEKKRKRN